MDAPHGHRYWRLDPTFLPISLQHPGAQLVLATGADGELLHHLRPHSNFSISFRVVWVPKPGARHSPGPKHPLSRKLACGRWWASRVCWARTLRRRNRRGAQPLQAGLHGALFPFVNWIQIPAAARRSQGLNPCRRYQPAACTRHDKAELSAIAFECWRTAAPMPQVPFTLTSFALSLLLVFRTNNSYDRCAALVQSWPGPCVWVLRMCIRAALTAAVPSPCEAAASHLFLHQSWREPILPVDAFVEGCRPLQGGKRARSWVACSG